jgi:hypothetical protein
MINKSIQNILYTEQGQIIISIVLGLGLATIFRNYCDGKNCYNFLGPEQTLIKNKIFSFDSNNSKCYLMKENNIKCGSKEQTIDFS